MLVDELAVVLGVGEVLALGHEGAVEQDRAGAEHLAKAFRAGGRRAGERWHRCVACGSSEATACEPMSSVLAGLSQVFARFVARSGGHAQSDCGGLVFRVVAGFALVWAGLVWGLGRGRLHSPPPTPPAKKPTPTPTPPATPATPPTPPAVGACRLPRVDVWLRLLCFQLILEWPLLLGSSLRRPRGELVWLSALECRSLLPSSEA